MFFKNTSIEISTEAQALSGLMQFLHNSKEWRIFDNVQINIVYLIICKRMVYDYISFVMGKFVKFYRVSMERKDKAKNLILVMKNF